MQRQFSEAVNGYVAVNESFLRMFGHRREELIGRTTTELGFWQDISDRGRFVETLAEGLKPADRVELAIPAKSGQTLYCEVSVEVIDVGGEPCLLSVVNDVTDRKQVEEALAESEELHRVTLNSISDAVFITDDLGAFVYVCPNARNIFGYSYDQVVAKENIQELLGKNIFDAGDLEQSGELSNIERLVRDKAGRDRFLLITVKRVSIKGGTVLYACRDITDRARAEKTLQESEERYRLLVETMNDGLGVQDENGLITYVNDAFCKMSGYAREEIVGHPVTDLYDEAIESF